jgi:hypothetical protein
LYILIPKIKKIRLKIIIIVKIEEVRRKLGRKVRRKIRLEVNVVELCD